MRCHQASHRGANRRGHSDGVVSRYDGDDTLHLGIFRSPENGGTPGDYDVGLWAFPLDTPNETLRLGVGRIRHRAGIHHTDVGGIQNRSWGLHLELATLVAYARCRTGWPCTRTYGKEPARRAAASAASDPCGQRDPAKAFLEISRVPVSHLDREIQGR